MQLYLIQHAEAKPKQEDPTRPLSAKGEADIKKVAAYIARNGNLQVPQIRHSGKLRAQQTAEALAKAIHPPQGVNQADDLSPLADPGLWAARLADTSENVMLVGHLPHMSKLAAYLLCQDENRKVVRFQMGGVLCLRRGQSGVWSVHWLVTPHIVGEQ